MSILDEFAKRFDEAQRPVREMFAGAFGAEDYDERPPRGFNPRVIVARIVLNTESPDVAEAVCEDLQVAVRKFAGPHYSHAGWAITTLAAME